jgi:hypothetical protein
MSALEVLQSCPAQRKALLKAIGGIDPTDTNLIVFDLEDHIPRLPPQLAFQIQVVVSDKNICRTVIDEGASTCVMSFACWKAIGSPPLNESQNTLKAFNGSGFKPYGVLPSLPITLEGKTVQVEVEVFDAPLDYNLLLGRSWIDSMRAVVSTLFHVVRFLIKERLLPLTNLPSSIPILVLATCRLLLKPEDTPWDDGHHRSIGLFLEQHTLENYQRISTPSTSCCHIR